MSLAHPSGLGRTRLPRFAWAAGAAVGAGGVAYLLSHDPHRAGAFPPCILLSLTGFACPACGGTRAAYDLFHGRVTEAFGHNPLVVVAVAAMLVTFAYRFGRRRTGHNLRAMPTWLPIVVGVTVIVFGVVRNLPGFEGLGPA